MKNKSECHLAITQEKDAALEVLKGGEGGQRVDGQTKEGEDEGAISSNTTDSQPRWTGMGGMTGRFGRGVWLQQ
jgi:hypothetical protein